MNKNFVLGKYYPGNSLIHRADPRLKFIMIIVLMYAILSSFTWQPIVSALIGSAILIIVTHIPFKLILKSLKPVTFIIILAFFVNLFSADGRILLHLWRFSITDKGLINAVLMSFRLLLIVLDTTVLLTLTTTPMRMADGLESLLSPLKKINVPVHEISMMMSIALRFVPTLIEETDKIIKAQSSRGADYDTGGIFLKIKGFSSIIVPLFVSSLRRADELAQAMEARCYRGGKGRSKLRALRYTTVDLWLFLIMSIFCGSIIYLQYI